MSSLKTIHKYPLEVTDYQKIKLPKDSTILTVQTQREVPCIWALVDIEKEKGERNIRIVGTGHPVHDNVVRYIGTFQLERGSLIFHVFEIKG